MAQQTGGRSKAVIFLVLALAVATLASLAVYRVLQESKKQLEEAQKPPDTLPRRRRHARPLHGHSHWTRRCHRP